MKLALGASVPLLRGLSRSAGSVSRFEGPVGLKFGPKHPGGRSRAAWRSCHPSACLAPIGLSRPVVLELANIFSKI